MCFSQSFSFSFAGLGLFVAWWINSRTNNFELASVRVWCGWVGAVWRCCCGWYHSCDWLACAVAPTSLQGVFFFFLMEFLQGLQYFVIADDIDSPLCANIINKILTILGYAHICLQVCSCCCASFLYLVSQRHRTHSSCVAPFH